MVPASTFTPEVPTIPKITPSAPGLGAIIASALGLVLPANQPLETNAVGIPVIVIGFSTITANSASDFIITVGTQPVTADPASNFVLGSQTISPGKTAIKLSGVVIPIVPPPSNTRIRTGTNTSNAPYPMQTFNGAGSRTEVYWLQGLATTMLCVAV